MGVVVDDSGDLGKPREPRARRPPTGPPRPASKRSLRRGLPTVLIAAAAGLLGHLLWSRPNAPPPRLPPGPAHREGSRARAELTTGPDDTPSVVLAPTTAPPLAPAPVPARPDSTPTESSSALPAMGSESAHSDEPSDAGPSLPSGGRRARAPAAPPPGSSSTPAPAERDAPSTAEPLERHVETTALSRWQQPGLCASPDEAIAARSSMMTRFRRIDRDGEGLLYLDPRLPSGAEGPLLDDLEAAERELRARLSLTPSPPDVFAYQDSKLLLAAACTNDDVVAYYDGALHVVLAHADVAQSVVHEYTHHALMSAGIVGPTWAQEGIAMGVARETWWLERGWLERVAEHPFSLDVMERAVPYTLSSEQAVLFYVQAAAMVACATLDEPAGLASLVRALAPRARSSGVDYTLPPLAEPAALRACATELLR
jgi:hypothetical protein